MKKAYLAVSMLFLILVIVPGIPQALQDYHRYKLYKVDPYYGQNPNLTRLPDYDFVVKTPRINFAILDLSMPFLLSFLVLYNILLLGIMKKFKLVFGIGLSLSLVTAVYGLYIGSTLEWPVNPGGFNQGIVFLGMFLLFAFLLLTLHVLKPKKTAN